MLLVVGVSETTPVAASGPSLDADWFAQPLVRRQTDNLEPGKMDTRMISRIQLPHKVEETAEDIIFVDGCDASQDLYSCCASCINVQLVSFSHLQPNLLLISISANGSLQHPRSLLQLPRSSI